MPPDAAVFGSDRLQLFLRQFLHQFGAVGETLIPLAEQVHGDGTAFGFVGFAPDEQEHAAGRIDLLGGEHPADGVGLPVRRLAHFHLEVVIVGQGERAGGFKGQLILGDQVDQHRGKRGKAQHLIDETDRLTEPGRDFLGVHAGIAQSRKGADTVRRVHVFTLEILCQRQLDGLFLAAYLDGEQVAVPDLLALHQFLEAAIAPSPCEYPQQAVFLIGDKVLQQAMRVNIVGHGLDCRWLDAALVERGKTKLRQLGGDDSHDECS